MNWKIADLIYWALAAAYLVLMPQVPFTGDFVVKAAPVLLLAVWVLMKMKGTGGKVLFAGLFLSAGGDVALSFVRGVNQNFFILGLGLFLGAHICYSILFGRNCSWKKKFLIPVLLLLAFSITMAVVLQPHLGDMAIPVFAYILVITVMGILSMLYNGTSAMLISGTLIFIISDSCIAVNKFLHPFEGSGYAIMITYYIAQFLIARSFLGNR